MDEESSSADVTIPSELGARDSSPTRNGRMTITLTASPQSDAPNETAKVRIELSNPELVAERVVSRLARQFPPESVMTIATSNGLRSRRRHRLLPEDVCSTNESDDLNALRDPSGHSTRQPSMRQPQHYLAQSYFVSRLLDMAVPVAEGQLEIRLLDGASMPVHPAEVHTVLYDDTGHAYGSAQASTLRRLPEPGSPSTEWSSALPDKHGIATFVQTYLVSDDLEAAVPVCPGQRIVHLLDGDTVPVDNDQVQCVFHGDRGVALFTRASSGAVIPGVFDKPGVAFAALPHKIVDGRAIPVGTSSVRATGDAVSRVLFDGRGDVICVRRPNGGLVPGGLLEPGAAARVKYFYAPQGERKAAAEILEMTTGPIQLLSGERVTAFPDDIALILYNNRGAEIGAYLADRRPSFVPQGGYLLRQRRGEDEERKVDKEGRRDDGAYGDSWPDDSGGWEGKRSRGRERSMRGGSGHKDQSVRPGRRDASVRKSGRIKTRGRSNTRHKGRAYSSDELSTNSDHSASSSQAHESSASSSTVSRRRRRSSRKRKGSALPWREQSYFVPPGMSYAIPFLPDQAQVKLANGHKVSITRDRVYRVEYNKKGFPLRTCLPDGRHISWASEIPGIATKVQDYFIHPDLLYAVPIVARQKTVSVNDGTSLPVTPDRITTVFYDAAGRPAFSFQNKSKPNSDSGGQPVRIRPGLAQPVPGMASSVQYVILIESENRRRLSDTHPGDEQYVIPVKAHQTSVLDPKTNRKVQIDRQKLAIVYFDRERKALYSQLSDGTLIAGGLLDTRSSSSDQTSSDSSFVQGIAAGWRDNSTRNSSRQNPEDNRRSDATGRHERSPGRGGRDAGRADTGRGEAGRESEWKHKESGRDTGRESRHRMSHRDAGSDDDRNNSRRSTLRDCGYSDESGPVSPTHRTIQQARTASNGTTSQCTTSTKRQEIIERRVPVKKVEYVERVVEVPEVHFVDKHVEVEQIEWQTKLVKKKKIVERPVEHIKYVPKIETKIVERVIEVPEIIEVPKPEIIEQKVVVDVYLDTKEECIVGQEVVPVIREGYEISEDVECLRLEPEFIPVDVYVPRLFKNKLIAVGVLEEKRSEVDVSLAHYNTLVLKMNPIFASNYEKLPMIKTSNGSFPLLSTDDPNLPITVTPPTPQEISNLLVQIGVASRQATQDEINALSHPDPHPEQLPPRTMNLA